MNCQAAICHLCSSESFDVEFTISTSDITRLYKLAMAVDIADEFSGIHEISYCRCRACDLGFFWPPITGSPAYYSKLQRIDPVYYLNTKPEYAMAQPFIRSTDKVLEVGSGVGNFSRIIGCKEYTGLEFNEQAVADASHQGINVVHETIEAHAAGHPDQYDVVCSFQVVEHVGNVREFLAANIAALRPRGLLLICVPSDDTFLPLAWNSYYNMPPHHVTRWSDKALSNIAQLFPVEYVITEHEPLTDLHKHGYAALLVLRSFGKRFRQHPGIDLSFSFRVLNKIAKELAGILVKGIDNSMLPRGHSVLAVYRKVGPLTIGLG